MTLDELCYQTQSTPADLEHWAELGVFGPRWREPRDRGKWRHITKLVAHRAILMRALLGIGLTEGVAASVAETHDVDDRELPLMIDSPHGQITIWRSTLDLP